MGSGTVTVIFHIGKEYDSLFYLAYTTAGVVSPGVLCTIGYSGKTPEEFIRTLEAASVKRVVDVRALPLSRRKGFSKKALGISLNAVGIEYVHLRAAGNPFRDQKDDIKRCLELYAAHVDRHPEIIRDVLTSINECMSALVCFEATACECHRSILADRLCRLRPRLKVRDL